MSAPATLVADLGGTSLRFALAAGGSVHALADVEADRFSDLAAAIGHYLDGLEENRRPTRAVFAAAGPQDGQTIAFTNRPWSSSVADIKRRFDFERLDVINDFAALALSLPHLGAADRKPIGPERTSRDAPMAVIGPGTGLGVGGLLPDDRGWRPVPGEGGHATLAARTDLEAEILAVLRQRHDHVSGERVLSGQGLSDLHDAVCTVRKLDRARLPAETITERAADDPACRETIDLFTDFLATVASDVALVFNAGGGLFVGGGIVPRLGTRFDADRFRRRFVDKGRFSAHCDAIPTFLVTRPNPALLGLAWAAESM